MRDILDRHNDLARAFRRAHDMIEATHEGLEQTGRTVRDASHAIREALDGMIAANTAALALYNEDEHDENHP